MHVMLLIIVSNLMSTKLFAPANERRYVNLLHCNINRNLPICFDIEGTPSPTMFVATTVNVILVEGGQVDEDVKKVSVHIVELQETFTSLQLLLDRASK